MGDGRGTPPPGSVFVPWDRPGRGREAGVSSTMKIPTNADDEPGVSRELASTEHDLGRAEPPDDAETTLLQPDRRKVRETALATPPSTADETQALTDDKARESGVRGRG